MPGRSLSLELEAEMELVFQMAAVGEKLGSIHAIALLLTILGCGVLAAGLGWVAYQSYRFDPVHGIVGVIFPPYALWYAFFRMEHRQKSSWVSLFVSGIAVAALGILLMASGQACEDNIDCGRPLTIEKGGTVEEPLEEGGSSALSIDSGSRLQPH